MFASAAGISVYDALSMTRDNYAYIRLYRLRKSCNIAGL